MRRGVTPLGSSGKPVGGHRGSVGSARCRVVDLDREGRLAPLGPFARRGRWGRCWRRSGPTREPLTGHDHVGRGTVTAAVARDLTPRLRRTRPVGGVASSGSVRPAPPPPPPVPGPGPRLAAPAPASRPWPPGPRTWRTGAGRRRGPRLRMLDGAGDRPDRRRARCQGRTDQASGPSSPQRAMSISPGSRAGPVVASTGPVLGRETRASCPDGGRAWQLGARRGPGPICARSRDERHAVDGRRIPHITGIARDPDRSRDRRARPPGAGGVLLSALDEARRRHPIFLDEALAPTGDLRWTGPPPRPASGRLDDV